ncbi:MAG: SDR family NAD(P)-dependent oxidoreductase [Proteobacteria bacterium]|nr:SDR family NAD(P)-dependent oxidoreductase [Pseudomonadota bacterium]
MNSRIPPGSVALVTGSSSGFGLQCCVELARRGMRVFASMRDLSRSEGLDAAMAEVGLTCDKVELDVTKPDSLATAVAEIADRVGPKPPGNTAETGDEPLLVPVDIVVNNAGFGLGGFVEDLTMDKLREQFETNFFGLVALTKAVLPGMRERRRGRIINISSLSGRMGQPGAGAYAASKFAVEGISESLRLELLPYGVYVVLIEPGMFRTDLFDRNQRITARALEPDSPNYKALMRLKSIVEKRLARGGDPRQVARVVGQAVAADKPRLRYLVGSDAAVAGTLKGILPFGLWERAVGRVIGAD